jgi:hypothetical protein
VYLVGLVLSNADVLWELDFDITGMDVQRNGPRSGSYDITGFFRKGVPVCGACVLENKLIFGRKGFEQKLAGHKATAAQSFQAALARGQRLAAQLLLVTQVSCTRTPATLRSELWILAVGGGWAPLRPRAQCATVRTCEGTWGQCATELVHRGQEVRLLSEFYGLLGLRAHNVGRDVQIWTAQGKGHTTIQKSDLFILQTRLPWRCLRFCYPGTFCHLEFLKLYTHVFFFVSKHMNGHISWQ